MRCRATTVYSDLPTAFVSTAIAASARMTPGHIRLRRLAEGLLITDHRRLADQSTTPSRGTHTGLSNRMLGQSMPTIVSLTTMAPM